MPYSAKAVANFFLDIAESEGAKITPMKLLKLVYFAHGWHLGITGKPLIDEVIEAWKFGPVVPSLYRAFKAFGMSAITERAIKCSAVDGRIRIETPSLPDDPKLTAFLQKVWSVYGQLSAIQLSNLTHMEGTPWFATWEKRGQFIKGTDIPDDLIQNYFAAKQAAATANARPN